MTDAARDPLCLLACEDAHPLGQHLAALLGLPLTPSRDVWFACGEAKHVIDANVRGNDVYIVQRALGPDGVWSAYDRFTMLLHAVDAARCADAGRVTAVLPYLPGTRQDKRKDHLREGVSTSLFARLLTAAGADMVVAIEPHNEAMVGCFDPSRCVFESVSVIRPFARHLASLGWRPDAVASTDLGGLERARAFAQVLECDLVALSKERDYSAPSRVARTTVVGEVRGRSVLVVDDIIDTAGSVVAACDALWEAGAAEVAIAGVHLILSDPAWDRLQGLADEADRRGQRLRLAGTNTVHHPAPRLPIAVFELEPLLADVIRSINRRGSVRALE